MTRRKTIAFVAPMGPALGAFILAGTAVVPWALAEQASEPAHHDHAHHHHPIPAGLQRSEASYQIPDVTLVDQAGRRVPVRDLLDTEKPVLVNFIYTTCTGICPAMTAIFEQVQKGLDSDRDKVTMISVSIDPEQDTPVALASYAERFGAGPQWVFLTGSLEDSIQVQQAFNAYRGDKNNHAPLTLLRAGREAKWTRLDGFANAGDLVSELRVAIGG